MGVFGDGDNKKKKKGQSDRNRVSRLAGLVSRSNAGGEMDWGDAMPEMLSAVILAVSRAGGMASFSRSRDRGALVLVLFLDGERETFYFNRHDEIDAELEKIVQYFDAITD